MEEWKPIFLPDRSDIQFYASSWGRLKSDPYTNHQDRLFHVAPTYGHSSCGNRMNFKFKRKSYKVHRLICIAFHGPPPFEGAIVLHVDEDYTNNRPENLKWGNHSENALAPSLAVWNAHRERHKGQFIAGVNKDA